MRRGLWEKCQDYLRKINRDIAQLLTHSRSIGTCPQTYHGDLVCYFRRCCFLLLSLPKGQSSEWGGEGGGGEEEAAHVFVASPGLTFKAFLN